MPDIELTDELCDFTAEHARDLSIYSSRTFKDVMLSGKITDKFPKIKDAFQQENYKSEPVLDKLLNGEITIEEARSYDRKMKDKADAIEAINTASYELTGMKGVGEFSYPTALKRYSQIIGIDQSLFDERQRARFEQVLSEYQQVARERKWILPEKSNETSTDRTNTTLENETNGAKRQRWDEASARVDSAVDGLGLGIDKGIRDTVVALNVHGINTFQSCEGHLDGRDSMSPYIDVKAEGADDLETQIDNSEGSEKDTLMEELYKLNLEERKKLLSLLGEFYQKKGETPFDQRLIVVGGGNGWARLENQGADIQTILSAEDRTRRLEAYQVEMKTFTDFLKNKFFTDESNTELSS